MAKDEFLAIGLMSGTSMDGVDCALVRSDGHRAQPVGTPVHIPYKDDLRTEISGAMRQAAPLARAKDVGHQFDRLADRLTHIHGEAIKKILQQNSLSADAVNVVGFHGQTLLHKPDAGWSLQIGNGQLLADICQIKVVDDFRGRDVAQGGQGAPLVPIYHHALLKSQDDISYPVAILNIGGVSNISWFGSDNESGMIAFDTGPGNAFLDDWIKRHTGKPLDLDGQISAKGGVCLQTLQSWLKDSFFYKLPPKSLDRKAFRLDGLEKLSLENGAATLVDFTVQSIRLGLCQCPEMPEKIYVCGGGRHNKTLMQRLKAIGAAIEGVESLGWDGDNLEAEAFAYLACRHLRGLPITYPGTTGIIQPSPGGTLYHPS